MCHWVLDLCPHCRKCGPAHSPYTKPARWLEYCPEHPLGGGTNAENCPGESNLDRIGKVICRSCIKEEEQTKKRDDKKKKDNDKRKDKDRKDREKEERKANLKVLKKSIAEKRGEVWDLVEVAGGGNEGLEGSLHVS